MSFGLRLRAVVLAVACAAMAPGAAAQMPTIAVEIYAFGPGARPVTDLAPADVKVFQDGVEQAVELTARPEAGRYELCYRPRSGRPGAMRLQALRKGLVVRGPDGGEQLQPRVIEPPSPLEAQLLEVLAARPDAHDLASSVALLDYERGRDGLHTTVAVEVSLPELLVAQPLARLQMLVRTSQVGGYVHHASYERTVDARGTAAQRLVWTVHQHLEPGTYQMDTVVRDSISGRSSVASRRLDVPPPAPGLRLGSVSWLQPFPAVLLTGAARDEPLALGGEALMPAIDPRLPLGALARFFAPVYPDPANPAPVTLELELLRAGRSVGRVPLVLPPPEPDGRIAFRGGLPTRTFAATSYLARFVARQGDATATRELELQLADMPEPTPPPFRLRQ